MFIITLALSFVFLAAIARTALLLILPVFNKIPQKDSQARLLTKQLLAGKINSCLAILKDNDAVPVNVVESVTSDESMEVLLSCYSMVKSCSANVKSKQKREALRRCRQKWYDYKYKFIAEEYKQPEITHDEELDTIREKIALREALEKKRTREVEELREFIQQIVDKVKKDRDEKINLEKKIIEHQNKLGNVLNKHLGEIHKAQDCLLVS